MRKIAFVLAMITISVFTFAQVQECSNTIETKNLNKTITNNLFGVNTATNSIYFENFSDCNKSNSQYPAQIFHSDGGYSEERNVSALLDLENVNSNNNIKSGLQFFPKKPLYEVFTSSSNVFCLDANNIVDNIISTYPNQYTMIKYQMNWPGYGDPYYILAGDNRRIFYGVNGIPHMHANGDTSMHTATFTDLLFNYFSSQLSVMQIASNYSISGNLVSVGIDINSMADVIGTSKLHIAVVENTTTGNVGSNGETEFYNVCHAMLNTGNGLGVNLYAGVPYTYSHVFDMSNTNIEDMTDLSVIVFVQDIVTMEVLQSENSTGQAPNVVSVSFNVDMNNQLVFNPYYDTLYIAGDLSPISNWAEPGNDPSLILSHVGSGIYSLTLNLDSAQTISYKYFINSGWNSGEWAGNPNREVFINGDTTLNDNFGVYDLIADFEANNTSGIVPLVANFTDLSIGSPDSWYWDFGDGSISTDQNPSHIYILNGTYDVTLIVSNQLISDTIIKTNFITVCPQAYSVPYYEGFEDGGMIDACWLQETNDNFDWNANSGSTYSSQTGPTGAIEGLYYIYTESSSPVTNGDTAIIYSPNINLAGAQNPHLDFWYHMYGAGIDPDGRIILEISTNGGSTYTPLWTQIGNQGNTWYNAVINLSSFTGIINFKISGIVSSAIDFWQNDFAIDNFSVIDPLQRDLGVADIISPASIYADVLLSASQEVEITIKNFGTNAIQEYVDLKYQVGGVQITENVYINLLPFNTQNFTFSQLIDISSANTYNLSVEIDLTNDNSQSNNVLDKVVQVNHIGRPAFAQVYSNLKYSLFDLDNPEIEYFFGTYSGNDFIASGTWINNSWYGITYNSAELIRVEPFTEIVDTIGYTVANISGISYDYSTNTLFALSFDGLLYSIDIQTAQSSFIGTGNAGGFINLACDLNGDLYSLDLNDTLYNIDPQTGISTTIGHVGFDANYAQDMEFDHNSGELYMAAYNNSNLGAQLRLVDKTTGNTTLVGNFQNSSSHTAFAIPYSTSTLLSDFDASITLGDVPLLVSFTDLSTGNPTNWLWDFGDGNTSSNQNPVHVYQTPGIYDVTLIASSFFNSDTILKSNFIEVFDTLATPEPGWNFILTGINHSILVPASANITLNGNPVQVGDYLGVFYTDDNGELACGGYQIYEGINNAITAWGNDTQTAIKDGFTIGETFKWKVWSATDNIEYPAIATYMTGFMNQGEFVANGISGIESLTASYSQEIPLPIGWNIFSTNIVPFEATMDSLFADISVNVELVKNNIGQIFWPAWNVNQIGSNIVGQGYQVKMNNTDTLVVTGLIIIPELTPISLAAGWNMIAYLRQLPAPIEIMIQPIVSDIDLVKDNFGQIYWPIWYVNQIGDMLPGQGYQMRMFNANILTYPANTTSFSKSNIQIPLLYHFKNIQNTGSNMSLMIPNQVWDKEPEIGSEIGIFSQNGKLVGAGVYIGENLAISIWGNDELSDEIDGLIQNEKFIIRIWNNESQNSMEEDILEIETWLEGDEFYKTNKISIVKKLSTIQLPTFELFQNTPNPFSETTEISFYIPEEAFIEIELFNLLGEKILTVDANSYAAGNQSIVFDKKNLSSGVYFYRLKSENFSDTKIMILE
ncbi:MAG: PKD domain-containing protein [Bacteroidetes bacterium]|jgi:PKD repeat protein|nr:PKD domain-containing protein [Bacteroidota bacterium]MBT6685458.1 PKD domain-containing protein [Bacteroidota bacterium]MBT7144403.1 PKD domain-containing protein [Bacteroidota bacterium]MBT7490545.1 PKD domain-containing protein [Bacteroidota bacterium]